LVGELGKRRRAVRSGGLEGQLSFIPCGVVGHSAARQESNLELGPVGKNVKDVVTGNAGGELVATSRRPPCQFCGFDVCCDWLVNRVSIKANVANVHVLAPHSRV